MMDDRRLGYRLMAMWSGWPERRREIEGDLAWLTAAGVAGGPVERLRMERDAMDELARRVELALACYPNREAAEMAAEYYREKLTMESIGEAHYSTTHVRQIRGVQVAALVAVKCMETERTCGVDARLWNEQERIE